MALEQQDFELGTLSATHRPWVLPLLRALRHLGGKAKPKDAIDQIWALVGDQLTEAQWATVLRNNYIRWTRHHLKKHGLIAGAHGTWELTSLADDYLQRHLDDPIAIPDTIAALDEVNIGSPAAPLRTVQVTAHPGFEIPVLELLAEGPAWKQALREKLHERLRDKLLEGDYGRLPNGHQVWAYRFSWTLTFLKKNGEVRNPSRAIWEITEAGRERLGRERKDWSIAAYQDSKAKVRLDTIERAATDPPSPGQMSWEGLQGTLGAEIFSLLDQRIRPDLGPMPELARGTIPRNIILYGPPGTGKTFIATQVARVLTRDSDPGAESCWRIVQFHPSYAYEDFVQGLRPDLEQASLRYRILKGPFLQICEAAEDDPDNFYVLVIDEINRGDPARIFGELLYGLEYRGESVDLASGGQLSVPENLIILGTMNSVDRSVALVDYALRRRFAFVRVEPAPDVIVALRGKSRLAPAAAAVLQTFNDWIATRLDRDHVLGHSFFLNPAVSLDEDTALERIWALDVCPLLEEYFIDDAESLGEANRQWLTAVKEALAELGELDEGA